MVVVRGTQMVVLPSVLGDTDRIDQSRTKLIGYVERKSCYDRSDAAINLLGPEPDLAGWLIVLV